MREFVCVNVRVCVCVCMCVCALNARDQTGRSLGLRMDGVEVLVLR